MKRHTRLEILQMVADGRITPKRAEMMLDGKRTARKSTLLGVRKGDKVVANKSRSLMHKFGSRKLTVDRLQFDESAGFCRMTFVGMSREDWYYENFFGRANGK